MTVHPTSSDTLRPGAMLDELTGTLVAFDLSCIHVFDGRHAPVMVHDGLGAAVGAENRSLYVDGIHLLDPTYQHYQAGHAGGFLPSAELVAARTVPGGLLSAGAFHPLLSLDGGGVAGHVAYLAREGDRCVAYSLLRRAGGAPFTAAEEAALAGLERRVIALLLGYLALPDLVQADAEAGPGPLSLDSILGEELPPRQCAVLCLSMQGYSLEDIGLALEISPNTARAHLQSAYRRLGVRNRGEVFAIVLDRIGVDLGMAAPPRQVAEAGRGVRRAPRRIAT